MSISDYEFSSGLIKMGFIGNPGVSKQELEMIADRLDIKIPQQLEKFYLYANGSLNSFGPYLWKFLPINSQTTSLAHHVGPRNYGKFKVNQRSFNPEKYIIFLDCLIELCMYAFCGDEKSENFGEVIGCLWDDSDFDAFIVGQSVDSFFSRIYCFQG